MPATPSLYRPHAMARAVGALLALLAAGQPFNARAADEPTQKVVVIGTAVLPGVGTPLNQVPGNVQILKSGDAPLRDSLSLTAGLDRAASSVNINDSEGNPYQADLNFRGFTASPALGTPQGLSVFVDGVRINEVFGDTVNWDLIPEVATSKITLIPGSNPVFGLNTLGGALNVVTKNGTNSPGTSLQVEGGSFGRRALEMETGGRHDDLDYFVAGNLFRDTGWGLHNPSDVKQAFAKTGHHGERTDVDLSLTLADTRLEGNQTLPLSMMDDIRQSYSWPDLHSNRMAFVNLKATHHLSDELMLEGNTYQRGVRTHVFNSNVNNDFDTGAAMGPGNQPTGNDINEIQQMRRGATLQLSSSGPAMDHANQWVLGASVDGGHTRFTQSAQEAGASRDTHSDAPITLTTSLHAQATSWGAYATDTLGLDPAHSTYLTLSARYNQATVHLRDQLDTALNGDHRFERFNPAVGLTFNPTPAITTYAAYNEGMRAPTPVELSCADPAAPCSLPNAFQADPALKAVVSKTWELGARGRADGAALGWSAAVFRTELVDDIQFISSGGGATSAGYFQNIGQTRRQGLELGLDGQWSAALRWSAHYSALQATYRTPLVLNSPSNSTAAAISCDTCADIQVRPGDHLPGIPSQVLKLNADWSLLPDLSLSINAVAQSRQYARGDENNRDVNGPLPGYWLFNLDGRYRFAPGWVLFAKVDNLFNRRYSTFGTLGQNVFTAPGNAFDASGATWRNEQFRTVGVPRGIWLGLTYRFGEGAQGGG